MFPNFTHIYGWYMRRVFWAPRPHKRFIWYFITGHFIVVFLHSLPGKPPKNTLWISKQNVKKCIKGITMPKISVKRRKVSCKRPFWPRCCTDWGKIAGTGSLSSSLIASLASAYFGLFLAHFWLLLVGQKEPWAIWFNSMFEFCQTMLFRLRLIESGY